MPRKKRNVNSKIFETLRDRAEKILQRKSLKSSDLAAQDLERLIHELRVHEIELEIQN